MRAINRIKEVGWGWGIFFMLWLVLSINATRYQSSIFHALVWLVAVLSIPLVGALLLFSRRPSEFYAESD